MKLTRQKKTCELNRNRIENPESLYKGTRVKHASISLEDICDYTKTVKSTEKNFTSLSSKKELDNSDLVYCSIEIDKIYIEYIAIVTYFNSIFIKWDSESTDDPPSHSLMREKQSQTYSSTFDDREMSIEQLFCNINKNIAKITVMISCTEINENQSKNWNKIIPQHHKSISDWNKSKMTEKSHCQVISNGAYSQYVSLNKENKPMPKPKQIPNLKKSKGIPISHSSIIHL